MVDFRAELAALVAAYDNHRKWTINAVFERLRQAVEHARDVLAQPEPAPAADEEVADLTLRPIPVSERLPGPEDCDEEERCWFYTPGSSGLYAYWVLREPDSVRRWETHWLPAHALPLPEVNDD